MSTHTYETRTDSGTRTMTHIECPKIGCGYSAEARTEKGAQSQILRHLQRQDHMAALKMYAKKLATA